MYEWESVQNNVQVGAPGTVQRRRLAPSSHRRISMHVAKLRKYMCARVGMVTLPAAAAAVAAMGGAGVDAMPLWNCEDAAVDYSAGQRV